MSTNFGLMDWDFSREHFLNETSPAKRRSYRDSFNQLDKLDWRPKASAFSKTNELWYNDAGKARPRNITCFDGPFTVAGAYFARLAIKLSKTVFPGFVSGVSLADLGPRIATVQ